MEKSGWIFYRWKNRVASFIDGLIRDLIALEMFIDELIRDLITWDLL